LTALAKLGGQWLRRYWITLAVLGVALLSAGSAMAADTDTVSTAQTIQGFLGGIIASAIAQLFTQRFNLRTASKANEAAAQVKTLARELGVDDPHKTTPDLVKMQGQITTLQEELTTVKNELVSTLKERDTARDLLGIQMEKHSQDSINAQGEIDTLRTELGGEREVSARLEQQLRDNEQRFHDQELKLARIEGRLDQQGIQDRLSHTMETVAKLLNDVADKLVATAPEGSAL
jgi:chromosome segregation ATPase